MTCDANRPKPSRSKRTDSGAGGWRTVRDEAATFGEADRRWYVAVLCCLTFVCAAVNRHVIAILVTPMQAELGISDTTFGLIAGGGFVILYIAASLPAGKLVDQGPRPQLLAFAVLLWSLATLATGFTSAVWLIVLFRLLVGVGQSMVSPATNSIVSDLFEHRHFARALSLISYGGALGMAVVLMLTSLLFTLAGDQSDFDIPLVGPVPVWRCVFIAASLPGLVLAPLLWFTVRDPARKRTLARRDAEQASAGFGELICFLRAHRRLCLLMLAGYGCYSIANSSLAFWLPAYFGRTHAMSIEFIGVGLGIIYIVIGFAALWINSHFMDYGLRRGIAAAPLHLARLYAAAGLVPAAGLALIDSSGAALVTASLLLFLNTGFLTVSIAVPRLCPNQVRGQVVALHLIVFHLVGGVAGPLIVGLFNDRLFGGGEWVGASLSLMIVPALFCAAICLSAALGDYRRAALRLDQALSARTA